MKYLKWQKIFVILIFIFIYGFLISCIPWDLVFLDTMVGGGDTGSHNYIAYYSREIFPKMKWWSPDWYAGFPFLYFYPPLLYYLTTLFGFVVPLNIAFKLITLAGTFLLPIAIFLCLLFLGFKFPIPSLGALLSLAYLFLEKFSIYGGNIPSSLSGEFSYSFAFALFFVFIGLLVKGIRENKYLIGNVLLLSLMVLIHPFSVIVSVLFSGFVFIEGVIKKEAKRIFLYLAKVFGLAFGLTAFWSVPFLALLSYTSKMSWTKALNLEEIFPSSLVIFQTIALIGIIYALFKKDKRIIPIVYIIGASLIPFLFLNDSSIWNARFLPFILMGELMIAAYGLGSLLQQTKKIFPFIFLSVFLAGFIFMYLPNNISYISFWMKWNYEGLESKDAWPELKALVDYLKELPYGRIMWEYRAEYDKFGTPRVLENLPIWTNKPTFEGLLIESSLSGYFHFINQAETTETPTTAIAGLKYPPFDFEKGVKHLQYFGAQYFLAFTDNIKKLADEYLVKLNDVGGFSIYEVPRSNLVEVLEDFAFEPKTNRWLDQSIDWYEQTDLSKPIVFYQNKKELEDIENNLRFSDTGLAEEETVIEIKEIKNDYLSFSTNQLYRPHLIKYTYFPGWQAKGAAGPYLVSPSFMMIIPNKNEVTLEYSYNYWDKVGFGMSILSLVVLVLVSRGALLL
ncbi:MAG: 6-pyruvoyl-tetrahydropterin synthase-related protein [Candidatus Pacebacteria bacterium]|nr:6-pyruvoyl-tetrahydropterin synthase-related protein [Candidatus Paceibacterota bacterium]